MSVESGSTFSIADFVRHHFESGMGALRGTPWWVWPLPLVFAGLVLLLLQTPLDVITSKPVQELAGPVVMGVTAAFALFVHRKMQVFFTLLLALFTSALFLREWHFWGTTEAILVVLAALAWWASSRREDILPFLRQSSVGALLSAALWIYVVTQFMDQHYLLSFNLFTVENYVKWNDNVEETLETVGHLFVLAAVVLTYRDATERPPAKSN